MTREPPALLLVHYKASLSARPSDCGGGGASAARQRGGQPCRLAAPPLMAEEHDAILLHALAIQATGGSASGRRSHGALLSSTLRLASASAPHGSDAHGGHEQKPSKASAACVFPLGAPLSQVRAAR
jgi:hypothetical protein